MPSCLVPSQTPCMSVRYGYNHRAHPRAPQAAVGRWCLASGCSRGKMARTSRHMLPDTLLRLARSTRYCAFPLEALTPRWLLIYNQLGFRLLVERSISRNVISGYVQLSSLYGNWCLTCGRRTCATGPADHCGPCCGPTSSCTGYWRVTSTFLQARAACATQKVKAYLYPCVHLDTAASNRDVRCKWHSRPKAVHLCACKQLIQLSSFDIYFE
jgi:hypothetical protein